MSAEVVPILNSQFMSKRHANMARQLEDDIGKLEVIMIRCVVDNELDSGYLAGQIAIFTDEADRQWLLSKQYKEGEV